MPYIPELPHVAYLPMVARETADHNNPLNVYRPGAGVMLMINIEGGTEPVILFGCGRFGNAWKAAVGGLPNIKETFAQAAARELGEECFTLLPKSKFLTDSNYLKILENLSTEAAQADFPGLLNANTILEKASMAIADGSMHLPKVTEAQILATGPECVFMNHVDDTVASDGKTKLGYNYLNILVQGSSSVTKEIADEYLKNLSMIGKIFFNFYVNSGGEGTKRVDTKFANFRDKYCGGNEELANEFIKEAGNFAENEQFTFIPYKTVLQSVIDAKRGLTPKFMGRDFFNFGANNYPDFKALDNMDRVKQDISALMVETTATVDGQCGVKATAVTLRTAHQAAAAGAGAVEATEAEKPKVAAAAEEYTSTTRATL